MRPLIVHEPEEPVTVHVFVGSSTVVTVKYVGVAPVGCVTVTVACPSPATAVGADGDVAAVQSGGNGSGQVVVNGDVCPEATSAPPHLIASDGGF